MTNVKFEVTENEFILDVSGHANYAEHGKDIVCAGISALVFALASYLDMFGLEELRQEQHGKITLRTSLYRGSNIFHMQLGAIKCAYEGIRLIAHDYPEFVELKTIGSLAA